MTESDWTPELQIAALPVYTIFTKEVKGWVRAGIVNFGMFSELTGSPREHSIRLKIYEDSTEAEIIFRMLSSNR